MKTQPQPDKIIATYQILGFFEEDNSGEPTNSSPSHNPDALSFHHKITSTEPTRSFAHVTPPGNNTGKNRLTIHAPPQIIRNPKNYTHITHLVFEHWIASFLCSYDAPSGILHNVTVIDMNEDMQKATGWRWEDDERLPTYEEALDEYRAMIKYGIHKKSRSKTVGLCTLKEKDEAGWHFLELRTRGAALWYGKGCWERMVGLVAKKLLDLKDPWMGSRGDDAGSKGKEGDEGGQDEEEGYKTFTECLTLLKARVDSKP